MNDNNASVPVATRIIRRTLGPKTRQSLTTTQLQKDADSEVVVETSDSARLDALPWSPFHTLVVVALGVTWVLDGLEVTLAGAVAGVLRQNAALGFRED